MLSFKPAIRRRFHLASDGKFSELYDLYLRNVADFTQFRADHPLDDTKDMSMESKADRFCALIEANEYSKANGLLHSSGLAPASEETHEQLQKLIVQRSAEDSARIQESLTARSQTTSATRRISFSHKDVKRALRKLHKFTAAGGSGWRNEFLKTLEDCSREELFDVAHFFELLVNNRLQLYQEFSAVVRLVPLRKKKGGIRPIGIGEPFTKVEGHLWADEVDDSAKKILRPFQFGYRCPAGGEACVRSFQFENDLWPMQLGEVDGINFFGEMERLAMVDGAALISPEYEQYTAGRLAQPTTYY